MRDSISPGIAGIVLATGVSAVVTSVITGTWLPLIACGAGVIVGLWAVETIDK
jgi:hypothetical protein